MKDLSSLIPRHHHISVGIASEAEIARIMVDVIEEPPISDLNLWRLIAIRGRDEAGKPVVSLRCLGFAYGDFAEPWITSDVLAIARDFSAIRTRRRVYSLGRPAASGAEIHPRLVGLAKQALASWGFSEALGRSDQ
ncbi:hypothetical protein CRT60_00915 [Azospirillum palustre]|uniref:Uncharacterized protein n=1 Tax=Azospirillum palustre TaxID=2044885 RepID=A0A2B8BKA7_9PROT|nr:hypothetical protein [Azospirillum palustre]PGH59226.1 hypothetical protein CRT60_00915 [Azospirillum palustre]